MNTPASAPLRLQSLRVRNFKAIIDSKTLKFGPLTVFIGNNGAGKSSVVEALETYQTIVRDGLDAAMQRWLGIEHVRHKAKESKEGGGKTPNPIRFELGLGVSPRKLCRLDMSVNSDPAGNRMFIEDEAVTGESGSLEDGTREERGHINPDHAPSPGRSMLALSSREEVAHVRGWQFLSLSPERMGLPVPQQRTEGRVRLMRDGSNVADVLLDLGRASMQALEGLVETMAYVLPYARDIQPSITNEIERKAWLQLSEGGFKVPGWMLSTGTLRMLALLALLRHPDPPPLILVEEIENGLDPRSVHLIVEEIRTAVLSGHTQVVLTTHSPYLLDLLALEHLVVVERDAQGHPRFTRPADQESLGRWAADFTPGKLYTMGNLSGLSE